MSISFIIPIYNVEKYLKQCIDSVLGQVKEEDEIILVNDGSKDRSNLICKKYLKMFPDKIIYIEKENGGLSSARNVGIRQATKDYIAFVDSDDYLKQGYVEVLENAVNNNTVDVVMFGYETFPNGTVTVPIFKEGIIRSKEELFDGVKTVNKHNDFCFSWRLLIKRNFLNKVKVMFDEQTKIGEDYLFNSQVLLEASNILVLKESLYMYRINNENSIMRKKYKENLLENLEYQYDEKKKIIKYYGLDEVDGWKIDFSWYYVTAFRDMLFRNVWNGELKNRKKEIRRILESRIIRENYEVIGIAYWKYSKRAAIFHFFCKYKMAGMVIRKLNKLCRTFLKRLDDVLKERTARTDIQIIISTHSPLLLSDVLPGQITRLDLDKNGYCLIKNSTEKAYFGANIHTILADGFFLDYTIGEYARVFLQENINWLKEFLVKENKTVDDKHRVQELKSIVPYIGDPLIKNSFEVLIWKAGENIYD